MSAMHRFHALGLAAFLAFACPPGSRAAQLPVVAAASAHVGAKGYKLVDPASLDVMLGRLLGDDGGMTRKDADISAIEKALLLVDLQEKPLLRLRYVLRYGQQSIDGALLSTVDVERYNLGPEIRKDAVASYGAANVAGAETFGVGPHVAWRFAFQPTAKSAALVLAASRREIGAREAADRNCLPRTCLSLETLDELGDWTQDPAAVALPQTAYPAIVKHGTGQDTVEEVAPSAQALALAMAAGLAQPFDGGVVWSLSEAVASASPILVVLIDRNLGQETMSDAALGIAKRDKDHDEHWVRISGGVFDGAPSLSLSKAAGPLLDRTRK